MKSKIIKISDLRINEENPRDESQENEEAAIKILFKNEKKLFNLMKSIAENGYEISERIIVVEHEMPNKYLVMDGNRRVTCVKLLNNPDLLPTDIEERPRLIKRINKIRKDYKYTSIPSFDSVVYDIPAEETLMKSTIQNKHTGENNGAGRLQWDYKAQNRFMNDEYKNYLVEFLDKILKVERSLSTMERIFGDPDLRTHLGVIIDKKKPEISLINSDSAKKIYYILKLLQQKRITVGDVYYKEDRENFYKKHFIEDKNWDNGLEQINSKINEENISEEGNLKNQTNNSSENLEVIAVDNSSSEKMDGELRIKSFEDNIKEKLPYEKNVTKPTNNDNKFDDDKRNTNVSMAAVQPDPLDTLKQRKPENPSILFSGIVYTGEHPGIKRVLYELHTLKVSTHLLSATYLIRTLLECTLQEYLIRNNLFDQWNKPGRDPSITDLLNYCQRNNTFQNINQSYQRTINGAFAKKDHDELNSITHGKYNLPSQDILWDIERRWRIFVKYMIEDLNKYV